MRLSDVARLAGVSSASVSRVSNLDTSVSTDVKMKVERAMAELNWVPNGAAKALASNRTRVVGALVPNLGHPNFGRIIQALQHRLSERGYSLFIGCTEKKIAGAHDQAIKMIERGIECLVLVGLTQPLGLGAVLTQRKIPIVVTYTGTVDVKSDTAATKVIGFDSTATMSALVGHLVKLGHRRFGAITISAQKIEDRMMRRIDGIVHALATEGLAIRPQHMIRFPEAGIGAGGEGFRRLFESDLPPTAIICTNDYFAIGALLEAEARGVSVPRQLSIAGFDDLEMASHVKPALTTVRFPDIEMGDEVGKYVVSLLEKEQPAEVPMLDAELVIRDSTGPAPSN